MIRIKESIKNHNKQLENWLKRKDYEGKCGWDLVKKDIKFVYGTDKADLGISWHGFVVEGMPKDKCILMKNEPPIYNVFFGKRLNDSKYTKEFITVMASSKTAPYDYYYNIPRLEYELVDKYFDKEKDRFLCTILRNKKWSYLANSLNFKNRKYNKQSLLKFRKKADLYFSRIFNGKYQSYGGPWHRHTYNGVIPGDQKSLYEVLSHYQLCFAPENSRFYGYVCEKAFQAMCCGAVPIYYGAPDVENYYPEGTYIDCRRYKNYKELCEYLKSLEEKDYEEYRKKMKRFVTSKQSEHFTSIAFAKTFMKVLKEEKLL